MKRFLLPPVLVGLIFQIGHFLEHTVQMSVFVFGDRSVPYMSPVATLLTHAIGGLVVPGATMARQMAVGMEILHLIGNLIFLATIAGLCALVKSKALRTALWIETFHLYEHVMLTSTVLFLGKAVGLSTLFGGADLVGHEFAVGFRVTWHFVMNAVPTIFVMSGLMEHKPMFLFGAPSVETVRRPASV